MRLKILKLRSKSLKSEPDSRGESTSGAEAESRLGNDESSWNPFGSVIALQFNIKQYVGQSRDGISLATGKIIAVTLFVLRSNCLSSCHPVNDGRHLRLTESSAGCRLSNIPGHRVRGSHPARSDGPFLIDPCQSVNHRKSESDSFWCKIKLVQWVSHSEWKLEHVAQGFDSPLRRK